MKVKKVKVVTTYNLEVTDREALLLVDLLGKQPYGGPYQQMFEDLKKALDD